MTGFAHKNTLKRIAPAFVVAIIATMYAAVFLSNQYTARASFVLKSIDGGESLAGSAFGILGGAVSQDKQSSLLLRDYLVSNRFASELNNEFGLEEMYRDNPLDFKSGLAPWEGSDETSKLIKRKFSYNYDIESGVSSISFSSEDPEVSKNIIHKALESGSLFVNQINNDLAKTQSEQVDKWVVETRSMLIDALKKLTQFQQTSGALSVEGIAQETQTLIASLQGDLMRKEAEYQTLSSFMVPEAYQLQALDAEIQSLRSQLAHKTNDLLGGSKASLVTMMDDFSLLKAKVEVAVAAHTKALGAAEKAKFDLSRKTKKIITVEPVYVGNSPTYPKLPKTFAMSFLLTLLALPVIKFVNSWINEHK